MLRSLKFFNFRLKNRSLKPKVTHKSASWNLYDVRIEPFLQKYITMRLFIEKNNEIIEDTFAFRDGKQKVNKRRN